MGRVVNLVTCWAAVVSLCIGTASAGTVLPSDPAAMAGWTGTQTFSETLFTFTLDAEVDFAVYAPGAFNTSSALGFPADPSGGADWVYAYQVFNTGGNVAPSLLSVGFLDLAPEGDGVDDLELPTNIGFVDGFASPDVDPVLNFSPDNNPLTIKESAVYEFTLPSLDDTTDILIYTSPFGPEWDRGSVRGGALINFQQLPSPVPEPGTFVLGVLGMALLLTWRLRRSRRPC